MRKYNSGLLNIGFLFYRWISPVVDPFKLFRSFSGYCRYLKDLIIYTRFQNREKIKFSNLYPCIHDSTETTPFDSHYFYQDIWAFERILDSQVTSHVDIGSRIDYVGMLSTITNVKFVDIRPLSVQLKNFECIKGSILSLPFENNSLDSISCLHVAEHIGLGRYGDELDKDGTRKACKELSRVLAVGGSLYFSLPVGKPRLCFNAHRIHSPKQILDYFADLKLTELSGIDDNVNFIRNIDIGILENSNYACGLFHFVKA